MDISLMSVVLLFGTGETNLRNVFSNEFTSSVRSFSLSDMPFIDGNESICGTHTVATDASLYALPEGAEVLIPYQRMINGYEGMIYAGRFAEQIVW